MKILIAVAIACLCAVPKPMNSANAADTSVAREPSAQTFSGAWKGTFETTAFKVTMDLSLVGEASQWQAVVKFSDGTREESPSPRELKVQDNHIAFAVTLDGTEIKFTGELAANSLAGSAEGFREGAKIGTGKWQLSRVATPAAAPTKPRQESATQSIENDTQAIKQVIQHYLDVTDKKDGEAIKKAFHPDTKLLSVGRSGLNQMTLDEWWGRVSRIPGNVERKSQVTVLEVSGLAAVVKIDFGRSKDYVSLLKINGEWKIVSKILSTSLN